MKPNEKGFTIIELTIAIAIIGLIASGATMGISQVIKGTERSNKHLTAVRQVHNAGYWISHDAQMAQSVELDETEDTGFPLTLTWSNWNSEDTHQIVYTLEDMPGSELKQLQRNHSINGGANEATFVAQYIDPDPIKTKCEFADDALVFTVTATVSLGSQVKSETRLYKVAPRPSL